MSSERKGQATSVAERLERVLQEEAPSWGIDPVPPKHRRLSGVDFAVLWGDLAVGLLVLLTGALLVPSLGFPKALLAIVLGSLLGCIPLALVGLAGVREGVPGMVLFRPLLGLRGSYVPSVLNVIQLIGWTGFEFWAMSLVANEMSGRLFDFRSYWLWLVIVAVICTALALGGPILVVRRWLERFGAWLVAAVALWISFRLLTTADLSAVWSKAGAGGYPGKFWLAVDLVIAMPVSWLPLVADYTRFGRKDVSAAVGTYGGYALGNIWFYALGALLVLGAGVSDVTPGGLGLGIAAVAGGWVVLVALLVGETDEAFADIYSAAVSSQNLDPRIPQRLAIVAVSAAGLALAAFLGSRPAFAVGNYEYFLLLLGSVFVPLFGVFVAHYFVGATMTTRTGIEGGVDPDRFAARVRESRGIRARAFVPWIFGFLVYQWSVPTPLAGWQNAMETLFGHWLGLPFPLAGSAAGASIPAFFSAMILYVVISRVQLRRRGDGAAAAS